MRYARTMNFHGSRTFSILWLVLAGTLTCHAAPFVKHDPIDTGLPILVSLAVCNDSDRSIFASEKGSENEACRLAGVTNARTGETVEFFHYDLFWGDWIKQSQLTFDESVQCFSEFSDREFRTRKNCSLLDIPWYKAVTDLPSPEGTFQGLVEFELSDSERQGLESKKMILPHRSHGYPDFSEARYLHEHDFSKFTSMNPKMGLLRNNAEEFRNILFVQNAHNDYKIEASDSMTKFIPISTRPLRNMEFADLIAVLLLLLLLPDYRKLGLFFRHLFARKLLKS